MAVQHHSALVWLIQASDDVEERRLASAVRADEPGDRPFVGCERHLVERDDPSEAARHVFDGEQSHGAGIISRLNRRMLELEGGVRRVTFPLPLGIDHVHCYLLPGSDGWTAVDTGLGAARCAREVGLDRSRSWTARSGASWSRTSTPITSARPPIWPS